MKKKKNIFDIAFRIWCLLLAVCLTAKYTHNGFNPAFVMGGAAVYLIQIAFNKGEKDNAIL